MLKKNRAQQKATDDTASPEACGAWGIAEIILAQPAFGS
jgi:hypothetical protein